jgi:thiosulfate reductase cytochrome b subunit
MRTRKNLIAKLLISGSLLTLLAAGALGIQNAAAGKATDLVEATSPLHPTFTLLDQDGINVLESGAPVSTMQTCGQCHDTEFITSHSFHSDLGLSEIAAAGKTQSGRAWDTGPGFFGKWNPLTYRYLSLLGDERLDLGTPDWLMTYGADIVGGGPAVSSREGKPLSGLAPLKTNPETSLVNETGNAEAWSWSQSGTMEMDCFLCHLPQPNNAVRTATIQAGDFGSASTATLIGSGLVEQTAEGWAWNAEAFAENGELKPEFVTIQDPSNENCALCHEMAHAGSDPLVITEMTWQTATTGQVISSQRISASGMNLTDKASITRSWDIHAERQLNCVDCHFSLNNPVYYTTDPESSPSHLIYDPRRLDFGEYLERPSHNFARGQSAEDTVAPELKGTMRRCESCHDASGHASWLPYLDRHVAVLACETCHIPQLYAPAIESNDWTVITLETQANVAYRGIELTDIGAELASVAETIPPTVNNLVTGYQPILLQRQNVDGDTLLAPYNLVTSFYWIYDDANGNTRPVRLLDLEAAWLENGRYAPEVLSAFDANTDGVLDPTELVLDTSEKQTLIASRLQALGLGNVRIFGEIQPYSINHNVTNSEFAVSDCQTCHGKTSRLTQSIQLSDQAPAGVIPQFVKDSNVTISGEIVQTVDGGLVYQPVPRNDSVYIFGNSRVNWIDWLGAMAFLGTLVGVGGHGTLRYVSSLRRPKREARVKKVYMYEAYERFWHWLQTFSIVFLLFTGLIIHRPDIFGAFGFRYMVTIHNVLAAILAVNAALSLFWHSVSGEIQQYVPRPRGFFDDAILQAKYYLRGIFKHEPHPFQKMKDRKLNPLQQATYFGLLNVLLPLQGITGILMWGVQRWPEISNLFGGLPVLAPIHSLFAWLFGAFIVGHVYLTTTGATPLEGINAMITGWEEVEEHGTDEEESADVEETEITQGE